MNLKMYDLIIIGTGPAGYTASIYASRYRINNLIIGTIPGGQIGEAHKICNFPGYSEISGIELANKMRNQVKELRAKELLDTVTKLEKSKLGFKVTTQYSGDFLSKTILLAPGTRRRKLGLEEEDKFVGKGVSYCATCDGSFYKNKTVAVVGGSSAATTAALLLSDIANEVYLIYRKGQLRGDLIWIEQVKKRKNIKVVYNTNIIGLEGKEGLSGIKLDKQYQGKDILPLQGLFVEVGSVPDLKFIKDIDISTDENGYIEVSSKQETNVSGVYAAGDITTASDNFRQAITACSEGAIAAKNIYEILSH